MTLRYRADIDGLRAVAVGAVVLYHAGLGVPGGYVGVDVFFVLSGFLITSILWSDLVEDRFSILRFYERRIRRIFPALFVVLALTTTFAAWLFVPLHLSDFGESAIAASVFLANVYFYLKNNYFVEAASVQPLLHTWSLAVEEQFYIVFPPLLWALWRVRRWTLPLLALLAALSLWLAVATLTRDASAAFYLPQTRAWELLAGGILAILAVERPAALALRPALAGFVAAGGLAMILASSFLYSHATPFPGVAAVPPVLGTVFLVWAGGAAANPVSRWLAHPAPVFVGKVSYSFYLWHWPVIVFATYVRVDPLSLVEKLGCVAAAFLLSVASWVWIEQPFRHAKGVLGRPALFGAAAAVMAATFGAGGALYLSKGLPGRMPDSLADLIDPSIYLHDRRECHRVSPRRIEEGLCIRGAEGVAPSFVLVGDSHADALSPGIFAAAADLGLAGYQYTDLGFRPLPGVTRTGEAGEARETALFLDFLAGHPEIRTVILTGFWEHQATGASYRHQGDVWRDTGHDGSGGGPADNARTLQAGLSRLAEALPDRTIVLLDDIPTGDRLDLRTFARIALYKGDGARQGAGLPAETYAAQRASYEPILQALAAEYPSVVYRPVLAGLCNAALCPLFANDAPVFRDGDHLTADAALALAPALSAALGDDLAGSK